MCILCNILTLFNDHVNMCIAGEPQLEAAAQAGYGSGLFTYLFTCYASFLSAPVINTLYS